MGLVGEEKEYSIEEVLENEQYILVDSSVSARWQANGFERHLYDARRWADVQSDVLEQNLEDAMKYHWLVAQPNVHAVKSVVEQNEKYASMLGNKLTWLNTHLPLFVSKKKRGRRLHVVDYDEDERHGKRRSRKRDVLEQRDDANVRRAKEYLGKLTWEYKHVCDALQVGQFHGGEQYDVFLDDVKKWTVQGKSDRVFSDKQRELVSAALMRSLWPVKEESTAIVTDNFSIVPLLKHVMREMYELPSGYSIDKQLRKYPVRVYETNNHDVFRRAFVTKYAAPVSHRMRLIRHESA